MGEGAGVKPLQSIHSDKSQVGSTEQTPCSEVAE